MLIVGQIITSIHQYIHYAWFSASPAYHLTSHLPTDPQMGRRLSVTNLSSENNLPTFRLNAPVVISKVQEGGGWPTHTQLCSAFLYRNSLLSVHRQHTAVVTPPGRSHSTLLFALNLTETLPSSLCVHSHLPQVQHLPM